MAQKRIALHTDNAVVETLLLPLYARALEARQRNPLIRDDLAAAIVEQIDCDFTRKQMHGHDRLFTLMRVREFDRRAQDFLARHPRSTVVHIGCGLDTRFERLGLGGREAGAVAWYDLDLPEVIAVRRQVIPEQQARHDIACSAFDPGWFEVVKAAGARPTLFLAEGVLPYFAEATVRQLFLTLADHFPDAELVCDAMTPLMVRMNNLQLAALRVAARLQWGPRDGREPEGWGAGIRLLDEWFYFDEPEPRLGAAALMRLLPPFARGVGIFHYRLGEAGA